MCIPVKLGLCFSLAFPCCVPETGGAAPAASSHSLHTLPGPNPPQRERGILKQGKNVNMEMLHIRAGHAATVLGPCTVRDVLSSHLQLCFPEGAASRDGLFVSSPSSGQAELLLPLQWSQTFPVFCVCQACILEENLWTHLCSSTHSREY